MIYLTNLNLNGNELQNAVIQPLAVAPANPRLGQIYCDSADSRIKWFNGTKWMVVGVVVESSSANGSIIVDGQEMTVYTLPKASATELGGMKVGKGLVATDDGVVSVDVVNNLTTDDTEKALSAAMGKSLKDSIDRITTDIGDLGGGDMLKATYDASNNGVVDDSEKLGGQLPSYYAKAADIPTISTDISADANSDTKIASPKAVKSYVDTKISATYKPAGSIATVGELGDLVESNLGYVYNFTSEFTTTENFVEGAGKIYPVGTNVVIVNSDSAYKYDVLAGFVDLSGYQLSVSAVKSTTFEISTSQTSNSMTVTGTLVVGVTVIDTVTKEVVMCDVDINDMLVTVSVSSNPTNTLKVVVAYV